jgi:multicomponent K+:H+ antiporter subunit G
MELVAELLIALLLVAAGIFGLVGSYGLIKLPDTMTRLHAPTKATTLGVGGVLIASMLYFAVFAGHLSFHELMITLFLLLTAPISAHFIAKAQIHRAEPRKTLPDPTGPTEWATFDTAGPGGRIEAEEQPRADLRR